VTEKFSAFYLNTCYINSNYYVTHKITYINKAKKQIISANTIAI